VLVIKGTIFSLLKDDLCWRVMLDGRHESSWVVDERINSRR
jgi:hypothetical protein